MNVSGLVAELEAKLNDLAPEVRSQALERLVRFSQNGSSRPIPEMNVANMHSHTFFSFNAYGYSPSSLAWLAKKHGFRLMGIVDFDVLDGVDEFLDACELLEVRASAGIETRVYIPEFSTREINSPGEPGVYYYMGVGFASGHIPPEVSALQADMRQRAAARNRLVLDRVNTYLAPVCIDYERDVLPLTPAGNVTERHIIQAYLHTASRTMKDPPAFWAKKLGMARAEIEALIGDPAKFQNLLRTKLIKRGGVGYVEPTPATFPLVEEVNRLILACGALPCAAWLDGSSQGEQDITELMELLVRQGVAALNVIPDRNWNYADDGVRHAKAQKLHEIVALACEMNLPLIVGTEMNSFGQKLVDDFDVPEMAPLRQTFLDGAHFIYGHTVLQRSLGCGYQSEWARRYFSGRRERNEFFRQVGYRIPPGREALEKLRAASSEASPSELLLLF